MINFFKRKIKTENLNIEKSIASIVHNDGTIYKMTILGRAENAEEEWVNFFYEKASRIIQNLLIDRDIVMLKMDCGTFIPKCNINRVTFTTEDFYKEIKVYL